jgi:nucleotide-binding universal stress UspA family protein
MKTILLPTDFSDASEKALKFAIEIAKCSSAQIVVTNSCFFPTYSPEVPVQIPQRLYDEAESFSESEMHGICKQIHAEKDISGQHLKSEFIYKYDTPSHEIISLCNEKSVDLLVMGTSGNDNLLGFLDSTTLKVMNDITCPILIVQKDTEYHPFKNVFFCLEDLDKNILKTRQVVSLLRNYDFYLTLLKIIPTEKTNKENSIGDEEAFLFLKGLKEMTNYTKIRIKKIYSDNPVVELIEYANDHDADLLVLLRQDRPWIKDVFHKSFKKTVLKKSNLPVLVLH